MTFRFSAIALAGVLCVLSRAAYAALEPPKTDHPHPKHHPRGMMCSVAAVNLAFGQYNPFRNNHNDTTGDIAVTCSGRPGATLAYTITLNAGGSGTFAQRRMRFGSSHTLNYNIYTGPARTTVWGDGSAGTLVITDSFTLHAAKITKHYPVYGRVFARQNVRVGAYSDAIVVTLDF